MMGFDMTRLTGLKKVSKDRRRPSCRITLCPSPRGLEGWADPFHPKLGGHLGMNLGPLRHHSVLRTPYSVRHSLFHLQLTPKLRLLNSPLNAQDYVDYGTRWCHLILHILVKRKKYPRSHLSLQRNPMGKVTTHNPWLIFISKQEKAKPNSSKYPSLPKTGYVRAGNPSSSPQEQRLCKPQPQPPASRNFRHPRLVRRSGLCNFVHEPSKTCRAYAPAVESQGIEIIPTPASHPLPHASVTSRPDQIPISPLKMVFPIPLCSFGSRCSFSICTGQCQDAAACIRRIT